MKSSMSGWSMLRMTIFAARRVLPPDLIAPAKESNPFMKESGPDAVPPEERPSCAPRRHERFDPVPDKIIINTQAVDDPDFIGRAAEKFGSQCVVVSIDVKENGPGAYEV